MNRLICVVVLLLAPSFVCAATYPDGWEYTELPAEDEFQTNRFGRSWSDPIYSGYMIVDDHYVDAPYVVEQRGFVVFVNGERVADGIDIRMVSPLKREVVTEDPGPPPSEFVKTTHVYEVLGHSYHQKYEAYWDHLGLRDQSLVDATVRFFRSLPCMSNVVDTGGYGLYPGNRCIIISDFSGTTLKYHSRLAPRPPLVYQDSGLYPDATNERGLLEQSLQNDRYRHVINQGMPVDGGGPRNDELPKWYAAFRTLESTSLNATQRFERLKTLRMLASDDRMEYGETWFPLHGFHTSSQLWQRLSGDMSWTNDAPARLLALTNGWQRIQPAFMRTQTVASATVKATPPPAVPEPTPAPLQATSTVSATSSVSATAPRAEPQGKATGRVWPVIGLASALVVLLFLIRRAFRK